MPRPAADTSPVIAILGGLLTALCWTGTSLTSARASRSMGARSSLALVMLTGLVVTVPFVVAEPIPAQVSDPRTMVLLGVAGAGNVVGLLLLYRAYHGGLVAPVNAIASTEGAIAAVIAIALGEVVAPLVGLALAVIALGVAGVAAAGADRASTPDDDPAGGAVSGRLALGLAAGAATSFGLSLYAVGQVAIALPIAWAVLPARVVGVAAIAIPLALTRRWHVTRDGAPWAIASGLLEVLGIVAFAIGARDAVAVASVLTCLFVPLTAIVARFLFHERLTRGQVVAIVVVAVGVALLGASRV